MANYIRFDWAMKRLLRNKANFSVLEGLLTTLLGENITIRDLLESESNQEEEFDKYNRVDMLAVNSRGELILIEVQNNNEYAYFQRMLFGTFRIAVLKIVHWPVFDSFPDISNLRCSFARSSLFTCLNCSCSSLLKERRCLMKLKTSSFVICFKSVISIFY